MRSAIKMTPPPELPHAPTRSLVWVLCNAPLSAEKQKEREKRGGSKLVALLAFGGVCVCVCVFVCVCVCRFSHVRRACSQARTTPADGSNNVENDDGPACGAGAGDALASIDTNAFARCCEARSAAEGQPPSRLVLSPWPSTLSP